MFTLQQLITGCNFSPENVTQQLDIQCVVGKTGPVYINILQLNLS